MLVFLCSAFLRTYLVSTFSLAFMLNSFSLLTTIEIQLQLNIYTTIWDHKLPSQNEGALTYQNLSSNLFCLLGCTKRPSLPDYISCFCFLLFFFNFSLSLRFRTGIKSCLRVSDHYLTSWNSSPHPTWRLSLGSLNTRVPCLCHTFSRTLNTNSPFLQRLVFPQFLQRSTLPFLIPSCNFLQQAPPCFAVSSIFLSLQAIGVCAHNVRSTSSPGRVATFGVEKEIQCTPNKSKNLNKFNVHNPIYEYK